MPTLPLYTPNPAHPEASHRVLTPGGYERWYFDAESNDGDMRLVATFAQGTADHPDYPAYLRRYRRYLRAPTRRPPPVPAELSSVSLSVYRTGRAPAHFSRRCEPGDFIASPERMELWVSAGAVTSEPDGSVRVRLGCAGSPSAPAAELVFRPLRGRVSRDLLLPCGSTSAEHHWIPGQSCCEVRGTIGADGGVVVPFSGRGYHDHHYGTGPASRWLRGRVLGDGRVAAFHVAGAEAPPAGSRSSVAEARWVEADTQSVRDVATLSKLEWTRYPTSIEFESPGMRLSKPRFLDASRPVWRIVYDVSAGADSGLHGRTALCEWI